VVGGVTWRSRSVVPGVRLAVTVAAILLLDRAYRLFEAYRDAIALDFSATSGFWRWVLAAALVVFAGAIVGLGTRSELPSHLSMPGAPWQWRRCRCSWP
jgi:hypothetical protein